MDRRTLTTFLEEYYGDFLFDDCQPFFFSRAGFDYRLPQETMHGGALDCDLRAIDELPPTSEAAVLGLHPNAEITHATHASRQMWKDLVSLQPPTLGPSSDKDREGVIAAVAEDVLVHVPLQSVDIGEHDEVLLRGQFTTRNQDQTITPAQAVLLQELGRWNRLVIQMATSLTDLLRALRGETGMSEQLDAVGEALCGGDVPDLWRLRAPATQKPLGSWVEHFKQRQRQFAGWVASGDCPDSMWLAGLHVPESFLTSLVQSASRARGWPLDKSTLYTHVSTFVSPEEVPAPLAHGSFVHGLFLEGAAWDVARGCLKSQEPKVLLVDLPVLEAIPVESTKLKLQGTFRTPVYVTQSRNDAAGRGLVFEADLATRQHASHWVLQGVALVLNKDT